MAALFSCNLQQEIQQRINEIFFPFKRLLYVDHRRNYKLIMNVRNLVMVRSIRSVHVSLTMVMVYTECP
jgi:hypothetical protein